MAEPTIYDIDTNATYAGWMGHDPNIITNRDGDYVVVYASNDTMQGNVSVAYSKDGGETWTRAPLFTNSGTGDGIIDDNLPANYEMGVVLHDEFIFIACRIYTGSVYKVAVTKCDIRDVANVADYTKWLSMDGTAAPFEGGGSNGNGYDIIGSDDVTWPAIDVIDNETIIVGMKDDDDDLRIAYWNGSSWSEAVAIDFLFTGDVIYDSSNDWPIKIRHTNDEDWIMIILMDATDTYDYVTLRKCEKGADPTVGANWTSMNDIKEFDYVIDRGSTFTTPVRSIQLLVDVNDNIHVFGRAGQDSGGRIIHNYWDGTQWVNGCSENGAGTRIQITIIGVVPDQPDTSATQLYFTDGVGNIFAFFYSNGCGMCTLQWDGSTWLASSFKEHFNVTRSFAGSGYLRRFQEGLLPVMMSKQTTHDKCYFSLLPVGVERGTPWFDDGRTWERLESMRNRLTTPYENSDGSNNIKLLLLAAEQKGELDRTKDEIDSAYNINTATGQALDEHGELIACYRRTSETDGDYRARIKDFLNNLIGGGTKESLGHTIEEVIPGITEDDYEIVDGYGTSGHGDSGHFAHIKVYISPGFDWSIELLNYMLDKARAACITIDSIGTLIEETITLSETVDYAFGKPINESITLTESVTKDIVLGDFAESFFSLDTAPAKGMSRLHIAGYTEATSRNVVGP